jgi:predicted ester cyclase
MFRAAFPDLKVSIEELVAEDDKVCARATTQGTHRETIFGIPVTGRAVNITDLTMVRIADDQITA